MVSRKTQKDVGKFKAKLAGPFTARQTVFIGMGTAVDILVCSAMHGAGFDINVIAAVCICIIAPFVLFGTVNPYGMTCEKFLYQFYIYHIVAPSVRKYCTHTALDDINTEISPEYRFVTKLFVPCNREVHIAYPDQYQCIYKHLYFRLYPMLMYHS